jgi:hypothetical protein
LQAGYKGNGPHPCFRTNAALTKITYCEAIMAAHKVTRSRQRKEVPYRRVLSFPQTKGKIIADVELSFSSEYHAVDIRFQDKTSLTLSIESCFQVAPVLADWKTGDYKLLKQWKPIHS